MASDVLAFLRRAGAGRSTAPVVAEMLRTLARTFELQRASFFLADEDGRLRPFASEYPSGAVDREMFEAWRRIDLAETALGQRVLAGEEVIRLERADAPGGLPSDIVTRFAMGGSALVAIALRSEDRLDGVLVLEGPAGTVAVRATEIATMVSHLALVVENARAFEREQARSAEAEALLEVSNVLARTTGLSAVLGAVAQNAAKVSGFERCSIFLVDEAEHRVVPTMSQFADGHLELDSWELFRTTEADLPVVWEVLRHGAPAAFEHPADHPDLLPREWWEPYGIATVAYLPLTAWGERFGVLELDHRRPASISAHQLRLAQAVAAQGAVAIAVSRLLDREQQANRDLEAASRAKDDFLSMLSHELRTPVATVQSLAETLELHEGKLDESSRLELLRRIREATVRQQRMIDDLLDTSRIVRGDLEVEPRAFDLGELLADVVAAFPPATGVELDVPTGLAVHADPDHVRQVVSNLLTNAEKYGRPPCTLTCTRSGDRVRLWVRDHGDGVPDAFVATMFEPFTQAAQTGSGVGLGLSIAQRLARANGGELTYVPPTDRTPGASFVLDLPVAGSGVTRRPRGDGRR